MADSAVGMNINDIPDTPATPDQSSSAVGMHIDDIPDQPQQAQPPSAVGMHIDDIPDTPHPQVQAAGPGGTVAREAINAITPTAAGIAAAIPGAEYGAGLGTAIAGPGIGTGVGGFIGGALAGFGAGLAASAAQEKVKAVVGLDDSEQRAVNAKANPNAATIGQLLPMAVGFRVGNIGDQIAQRLTQGAAMGALDVGQQAIEKGEIDPSEAAMNAGAGFLLNQPRPWLAPYATKAAEFGAKMAGRKSPQLYPPGRPDLDQNMADQKVADQATVTTGLSATSDTRGASQSKAAPKTNIDPSTMGDAKTQSSTPKSGDGGSSGIWAKDQPSGGNAGINVSDGSMGLGGDPTIAAATSGAPSAEEAITAHNTPGAVQTDAPIAGDPIPPGERPFGNSNNTTLDQQIQQLNDYKQQVAQPPEQRPFGTTPNIETSSPEQVAKYKQSLIGGQEAAAPAPPAAEAARATSKQRSKLRLPAAEPPAEEAKPVKMSQYLPSIEAGEGRKVEIQQPTPPPEKQTAEQVVTMLRDKGLGAAADKIAAIKDPTARNMEAARAASMFSNVTGKIADTLKNLRVRNPDRLADLDVAGYTNPRTGRPTRAKSFTQKYVNEAVHEINDQVHNTRKIQDPARAYPDSDELHQAEPGVTGDTKTIDGTLYERVLAEDGRSGWVAWDDPERAGMRSAVPYDEALQLGLEKPETKAEVEQRAQAILDEARARAKDKAAEMEEKAQSMMDEAQGMKRGNDQKAAKARASAMKLAAEQIGNGKLPVENYAMSGLHKPEAWRMQRHAKDFLEGKFPEVDDTTENLVPPHEKFLADEQLIRKGGDAYDAFVENNQAEAAEAKKPAARSNVEGTGDNVAEKWAAKVRGREAAGPEEAKVETPIEAAEPTSASEYYETEEERRVAETREDRVNDKLYTLGKGKIVEQLQAMPIGEARENNYKTLEDRLLKGKQDGPGMQPMARKKDEGISIPEAQKMIEGVGAKAKSMMDEARAKEQAGREKHDPEVEAWIAKAQAKPTTEEGMEQAKTEAKKEPPLELPLAAQTAIATSKRAKANWSLSNSLIGRMFGAANISPASKDMATRLREAGGINERRINILAQNVKPFEKILNTATEAEREAFVHGVDTGDLSKVRADLHPLATIMAEGNKDVRDIGATMPNADKQEWLDNHFKHYFENNTDGSSFGESWFTNQGSAASLAHRSFPTYADAEKAGYKMAQWVKDDPIRAYMEYQNGIRSYQKDVLLKKALVDDGLGVWIGKGETTHPERSINLEGMTALNGRTGGPAVGNRVLMVPEDMARLYNNSVSKSFAFWPEGAEAADMLQRSSNAFNMMLLAGPLFHGSMTLGESVVNQTLMAVARAASGDWRGAASEAARVPIAPYNHYNLGAEINKIALNPTMGSPAMRTAVNYLTRARASFGKNYDPSMHFTNQRSFLESIKSASLQREWNAAKTRIIESDGRGKQAMQALGEVGGLIGKTLKTIAEPLFDHIIPNIKSGVNAQQLMGWMAEHQGASDAETLKAAQRITDNTDNTLGEMRYDNLFWNKTMTQIMQSFILAPSYTAGTLRAIGGGAASAFQHPERLSIKSKDFDPRAAYVVALPLAVMLSNALYQYIKTGSGPQDLQDLLMGPKTGGKTPNGDAERAALPGYWRQITGTYIDPWGEAYNKLGALPKGVLEGVRNKDYRDQVIADPRDGLVKRLFDHAMFMAKSTTPIVAQQMVKGRLRGSNISTGESLAGIRPSSTTIESPGRIAALKAAAAKRAVQSRNRANTRENNRKE